MTPGAGLGALVGLALMAAVVAAWIPPVAQDPAYHRMADGRMLLGIPNALNVLSNLPFVLVGALGCWGLRGRRVAFRDPRERRPYRVFFAGLLLTGLGSAYYHLAPDNARLAWDRLPLAVALMALFAAIIGERLSVRAGLLLLPLLVALGAGSVWIWYRGELLGGGDLRLYGMVQFYPLLAVPILSLLPPRYSGGGWLLGAILLYALAKAFEALDAPIFGLGRALSGHTLKHLFAALSGYAVWRMLQTRQPAREDH